jgi:hypothetical protein
MRGERQTHEDDGDSWQEFHLHDRSSYVTATKGCNQM